MVNGPVVSRRVDLAHLATIEKILTAARDRQGPKTGELLQLSRQGDSEELRRTATRLQDIIISGVQARELDFTTVAARGAELILELNHQLAELTAQKVSVEAELAQARGTREESLRELQSASGRLLSITPRITDLEGQLSVAREELSRRPTVENFTALESGKAAVEAELAQIKAEKAAWSRELLAAQARVQEKSDQITELGKRLDEIDQARRAAISHQDELQIQRDGAVTRQGVLQGQVDDLQSKIVDAERIRKEKIDTEKELSRLRTEVGQLRRELGQAREDLERVKNDPEIAGIRSRIADLERLLGERETELSQRRTKITELEGALTESEFGHSQKSGEMAETLRARTDERDSAQAELVTTRTELERFRQWAEYGMRTYNETLPGLAQQIQQLQESEAAMVLAHQHFATQKEEEIALLRSTPRKLPPALNLLAELKDKDPKAYHFLVKILIHIATQINVDVLAGAPLATIGIYDQKTLPSGPPVKTVGIEEFQNRAVIVLDMVARAIKIREQDKTDKEKDPAFPSTSHQLDRLYRFFTKPETTPAEKFRMVEFLDTILQDPSLIQVFIAQIEKTESTDVTNVRKGLLAEIASLATANANEYTNRAQILYRNYREELEAFLNDTSIDDTTKVTIRKIMTDASTAAEETISFGNGEPEPAPAPQPKKVGFFKSLFGNKDKDR